MRRISILLSLIILGASGVWAQGGKIGYVDSQRIFAELPEFQEAEAKFDGEVKDWEAQATAMKEVVDSMIVERDKNSLVWSMAKKNEVETLLAARQDSLQRYLDETFAQGGKAERRMAELSKPLKDRVISIIRRLAIENDYDMVFDAAVVSIAFAKESLDLTDEVLAELAKEK